MTPPLAARLWRWIAAPHARVRAEAASAPRWEYRCAGVFVDDGESASSELNPLGRDGWEAVGVMGSDDTNSYRVLLKRRLP